MLTVADISSLQFSGSTQTGREMIHVRAYMYNNTYNTRV